MMRLLTALSVAAFVAGGWPARAQNQNPTFRGGVRTVAVYATVQDRGGRLVPDLTREDFEILDNGRPVQLTVFSNEPLPISTKEYHPNLKLINELKNLTLKHISPTIRTII